MAFYERNYQHLTGIELIERDGRVLHNQSVNFYRKCIENKLSVNEFQFKKDGTTYLKLAALPSIMNIAKITKITGDYNNVRPYLFVDKVVGNVNFCLGLSREGCLLYTSNNSPRWCGRSANSSAKYDIQYVAHLLGLKLRDAINGIWYNQKEKISRFL